MLVQKRKANYNFLVAKISFLLIKMQEKFGNLNDALINYENLATFCASNYIGSYRWHSLENSLIDISQKRTIESDSTYRVEECVKDVLHVITAGFEVGGHTELLVQWIKLDSKRSHSIVLTNQFVKVPDKLNDLEESNHIKIFNLTDEKEYIKKATKLRRISLSYHVVILHTHPFDIVPTLAFGKNGGPPILLLNNADHLFWVNTTIADLVVELRDFYVEHDRMRRQIENIECLPIPIRQTEPIDREEARLLLGLKEEDVVLLSIASEYKFTPKFGYDFFSSLIKVLNQCPQAVALIIGVDEESDLAKENYHPQLRFLGVLTDTNIFEVACDIYIESFPFVSHTSIIQTVGRGKPCHLIYNPTLLNKCFNEGLFEYSKDEPSWCSNLVKLISNIKLRESVASKQSEFVIQNHFNQENWRLRLESIYDRGLSERHFINKKQKTFKWFTDNEIFLTELFSNGKYIAGIVSSRSIIGKIIVHLISKFVFWVRFIYFTK